MPRSGLPLVTTIITALCVTLYVLTYVAGLIDPRWVWLIFAYFALAPSESVLLWQPLTYAFLHANLAHLALNMLGLWIFGRDIESEWGPRHFAAYYLTCVVGAAVCQLGFAALYGTLSATVGASGGIFGILLAFAVMFPDRKILLLIPPIPVKAKYVVIGFGTLELILGVTGTFAGVAHFAHLGGMLFGGISLLLWRKFAVQPQPSPSDEDFRA